MPLRARVAVIDAGTNTVKLLVAERTAEDRWRTLVDRVEATRLGEGLQPGGRIGPEVIERTATAIGEMASDARRLGATRIAAVGTAALRMASNREEVVSAIRERTGVVIEVIPGGEEARLAFIAVTTSLGPIGGRLALFDTGGGSTQITLGHSGVVETQESLPVGAVRYTERFGLDRAVGLDTVQDAMAAIASDLAVLDGREGVQTLVGIGGGVVNLVTVSKGMTAFDPTRVHGSTLERAELDRQIERYRTLDVVGRRTIAGLQPARADVILAGACIVRTIMGKFGVDSLIVSDRGLRHGVLADRFAADRAPATQAGS